MADRLGVKRERCIKGTWGASENNRKAGLYTLTAAGKRQLAIELWQWERTTDILAGFLATNIVLP